MKADDKNEGILTSNEEGTVEQIIISLMAMVALGWSVSVTPSRTVNAPVRFAQGLSLHCLRKRLWLNRRTEQAMRGKMAAMD